MMKLHRLTTLILFTVSIMAKFCAVLFLLPTLIAARINVHIVASDNESKRDVELSGHNIDLITDTERTAFQLNDDTLKNAASLYFGRRPADAYLRSPTPWGDLYQSFEWAQVSRILTPQKARILAVTSEPTIVATQIFHNNSTKTAQFKAQITQDVDNMVSSTWEKGCELSIGQSIEYGFDIAVASVSGKTEFSYTSNWGESATKSETVRVGTEAGVTISLEPNQTVIAELYATRGSMKIQVDYKASLSGSVAVNYDDVYRGHHFWSLDVNAVMKAGGLKRSVRSSEMILLNYYSDSKVVLKDSQTKFVLYSIPVKMIW